MGSGKGKKIISLLVLTYMIWEVEYAPSHTPKEFNIVYNWGGEHRFTARCAFKRAWKASPLRSGQQHSESLRRMQPWVCNNAVKPLSVRQSVSNSRRPWAHHHVMVTKSQNENEEINLLNERNSSAERIDRSMQPQGSKCSEHKNLWSFREYASERSTKSAPLRTRSYLHLALMLGEHVPEKESNFRARCRELSEISDPDSIRGLDTSLARQGICGWKDLSKRKSNKDQREAWRKIKRKDMITCSAEWTVHVRYKHWS